jgi:Cu(I)/Ag(I) efflux system membrane fusion protein
MTADVDIITRKEPGVLSVPNAAVKPYQKGRAVRKLGKNGEIEYLPVKVGIRGKENTQIIEGLVEGQKIIVSLTNEKAPKKSPFGF